MKHRPRFVSHAWTAGVLLLGGIANAQTTVAELEEITVTAQRRAQSIEDVSIAIDVFSGDELSATRTLQMSDIAQQTPNLNIHGPFGDYGYPEITIRGVNADSFQQTSPQSAGTYVDGVYLTSPPLLAFQMFDLERVEVLKGPQGTLYGRNTTGGAVNFISRKPTFETEGHAEIGYGNYERMEFDGAIGGPLSETLAGRVSAQVVNQSSGPLRNSFTGEREGEIDRAAWRGQLLFKPSEDFDALLNFHGGRDKSDAYRFSQIPALDPGTGGLCADFLAGNMGGALANCVDVAGYRDTDGDPYTNAINHVGFHDNTTYGGVLELNWHLAAGTLTSLTSYDDFERRESFDEDGGPFRVLDSIRTGDVEQFSQEVHFTSNGDGPLTWIAGAYYGTDTIAGDPDVYTDAFDWFGGDYALYFDLDTDTWAAFVQTEYQLAEPLKLTTGVRYTSVQRDVDYSEVNSNVLTFSGSNSLDESEWSGRVALDYKPARNALLYVSVSRGFNAGTFNTAFAGSDAGLQPTDRETLLAYEVGAKISIPEQRLRVSGAVFYYDYEDMQVTSIENRQGIEAPYLTNAEGATLQGAELEISWEPLDRLELRLGGAYLDSELRDILLSDLRGVQSNYRGNRLANSPEWSFNALARYQVPVTAELDLAIQADASWEDDINRDLQATPILMSDAHWVVNGRVSLLNEDQWNVAVWGKNLTDEQWVTEAYQVVSAGMAGVTWSYPRTYGVSVRYSF